MEVVISTTADEAGKLAADAIEEVLRPARCRPRGRNRIKSLDHLRRTRPPSGAGFLVLAKVRAFMLDEYVGLPETIRSGTGTSSRLSSSTRSISIRLRYLGRTGWPRPPERLRGVRTRPLRTPAVSTYRFLGSAPTGISRSTNRVPRLSNPDQDVDQPDPQRQRSILRRERGGRPAALPDPRHRHHPAGTPHGARCLRARKGGGRPPARGRTRVRDVASHSAAAHPHVTVLLDTPRLRVFSSPPTTSRPTKANRLAGLLVVLTTLLPGFAGTVLPSGCGPARAGLGGVCLCAQHLLAGQLRALTEAITAENRTRSSLSTRKAVTSRGSSRLPVRRSPATRCWAGSTTSTPPRHRGRDRLVAASGGLHRDFAPCVDVNPGPTTQSSASAAFPATPNGWRGMDRPGWPASSRTGVAATAKHFPGTATRRRTRMSRCPLSTAPSTSCARRELPFARSHEAGCRVVMTSHILVQQLDGNHPATMSRMSCTICCARSWASPE